MSKVKYVVEGCRQDGSWAGGGEFETRAQALACAKEMRSWTDVWDTTVERWENGEPIRYIEWYSFRINKGWERR